MLVKIEYKGRTYAYSRDAHGIGFWYPTSGMGANVTVPLMIANELMAEAKKQGVNQKIFSKPKTKEKAIRVGKRRKAGPKRGKFSISLSSLVKKLRSKSEEESKEE